MKKNRLLIVSSIVLGIAIIVFSLFWPPVPSTDASGTFSKADKYKENTVNEGEIILNSELLADTNKTKKTIADLIQFGDFTLYVKSIINQWWIPVLEKYNSSPEINNAVINLREFNSFIDNNSHTIQNTIITIAGFYADKKKAVTTDVESQIKQFYNYANQFLLRDSIFEATISKIDITVKNDNTRKKEIAVLKSLRDRIVIDNFIYALSIGDTSKILYSSSQVLNSPKQALQLIILNQDQVSNSSSIPTLESGSNQSYLNQIKSQMIDAAYTADAILTATNTINSCMNQFGVVSFCNAQNGNYFFSKDNLSLILNQESLGEIWGNQVKNSINTVNLLVGNNVTLGQFMNLENLGCALNKENLGLIIMNADKLNSFTNQTQLQLFDKTQLGMFNQSLLGNNNPILF